MTNTDTLPLPSCRDPRPMAEGGVLVAADLPAKGERGRWTALYKMLVAEAVKHNLITAEEAIARYCMTARELRRWIEQLEREGRDGLKANNFAAVEPPLQLADIESFNDGSLAIDFRKRTIRLAEQLVDISPLEFRIFSILVRGAPAVVDRETMFAMIYSGRPHMPELKILDVVIHHLRSKFGRSSIETVWGRGWTWKGIAK